jgi:hypothetical protein
MSAEGAPAPPAPAPAARLKTPWIVWAFAIVGGLGVIAFIALVAAIMTPGGNYQPAKVAGAEEVFSVVQAGEVQGTGLLRLEVTRSLGGGGSNPYSSGGEPDVRNIILLDRADGTTRRLLPDNRRTIHNSAFLPAETELRDARESTVVLEGEKQEGPPAAYYVLTLRRGRGDPLQDILIGRLADKAQAVAMSGVEGIDSFWMQSPTRIGFVVREKLALYYRVVDTGTLKVVESRRIEIG